MSGQSHPLRQSCRLPPGMCARVHRPSFEPSGKLASDRRLRGKGHDATNSEPASDDRRHRARHRLYDVAGAAAALSDRLSECALSGRGHIRHQRDHHHHRGTASAGLCRGQEHRLRASFRRGRPAAPAGACGGTRPVECRRHHRADDDGRTRRQARHRSGPDRLHLERRRGRERARQQPRPPRRKRDRQFVPGDRTRHQAVGTGTRTGSRCDAHRLRRQRCPAAGTPVPAGHCGGRRSRSASTSFSSICVARRTSLAG